MPNVKKIAAAFRIVDRAGLVTYEAEVDVKDLIFDNKGHDFKNRLICGSQD